MLYTIKIQSGETQVTVVLLAKTVVDGKTYYFNHSDLLASDELVGILNTTGDSVNLDSSESLGLPYLTTSSEQTIKVTPLYTTFLPKADEELPEVVFDNLERQLSSHGITKDEIKELFKATKVLRDYLNGDDKFNIKVPMNFYKNFERTSSFVNKINQSKDASLRVLNSAINKTNFMSNPDDKVFIRIPSYEEILTNEATSLIPPITEVFRPYDKEQLMTPNYRNYLTKNDNIEHILGSADNNDIDIQENEMDYYEGLKELINYSIQQEYPDKTLEECVENGISSPDVKDYLIELAIRAATWNFSHTGYLPLISEMSELEKDSDSDDDDDDLSSSNRASEDTLEGRKTFSSIISNADSFVDGSEILKYVIESAAEKNVYAPAEAVIKLLRWGKNKPTRLKLTGIDKYLDLNTYRTHQQSGSFTNLEVEKVDGATYQAVGLIEINENLKDPQYIASMGLSVANVNAPVGLLLQKKYTNGAVQFVHMSIIDFILDNLKQKDEAKVARISVNNQKIEVSPQVEAVAKEGEQLMLENSVELVRNDLNSAHVYYRSNELKDLLMSYNIPSTKLSYLSILNEFAPNREINLFFTTQTFETHSELLDKIKEYGMPAIKFISTTLGREVLKITTRVSERIENYKRAKYDIPTLEQVLNFYKDVIVESGFTGDLDFSDDKFKPISTPQSTNVPPSTPLSAFGDSPTISGNPNKGTTIVSSPQATPPLTQQTQTSQPQQQSAVGLFDPSALFLGLNQGDNAFPVVDKGVTVGYVVLRMVSGKKIYIFCKLEDAPNLVIQQKSLPLTKLMYVIMDLLRKVASNRPQSMNAKFSDISTLDYYFDLFKKY